MSLVLPYEIHVEGASPIDRVASWALQPVFFFSGTRSCRLIPLSDGSGHAVVDVQKPFHCHDSWHRCDALAYRIYHRGLQIFYSLAMALLFAPSLAIGTTLKILAWQDSKVRHLYHLAGRYLAEQEPHQSSVRQVRQVSQNFSNLQHPSQVLELAFLSTLRRSWRMGELAREDLLSRSSAYRHRFAALTVLDLLEQANIDTSGCRPRLRLCIDGRELNNELFTLEDSQTAELMDTQGERAY